MGDTSTPRQAHTSAASHWGSSVSPKGPGLCLGLPAFSFQKPSPLSDCALWTPALQRKKIVLSKINYHDAIQSGVGG